MNVVRANRIGISVVVIVLFIIINLDRLTKLVTAWVRQLFTWFSSWMSKPEPEPQDIPELPLDSQVGMPPQEFKPQSAWSEFIDMVVYYAGYVVVFLVVVAIAYLIIVKLIIPLFNRFISTAKLTRELEMGYLDEEEKLEAPQLGQWFRGLMNRRSAIAEPEDNEGRIRYLYRESLQSAIKKGYEFKGSQTPLEIGRNWPDLNAKHRLPDHLIALYNKARYGEAAISDEEIMKLKDI